MAAGRRGSFARRFRIGSGHDDRTVQSAVQIGLSVNYWLIAKFTQTRAAINN
jgi:hypothetical protein